MIQLGRLWCGSGSSSTNRTSVFRKESLHSPSHVVVLEFLRGVFSPVGGSPGGSPTAALEVMTSPIQLPSTADHAAADAGHSLSCFSFSCNGSSLEVSM